MDEMTESEICQGPPEHFEDLGPIVGMSNFDHSIDEAFEEKIKTEQVFGYHASSSFNGRVWWDGEWFCEQVWVFGHPLQTYRADTLQNLMKIVNDRHGWA